MPKRTCKKCFPLLWGVFAVLVCTMLLYEALLYDRMLSAQWINAQHSAQAALSTIRSKLGLALRLGIPLERYGRAPALLQEVSAVTRLPLALCNDTCAVLHATGTFSPALSPQELSQTQDMQVCERENGRLVLLPLLTVPGNKVVGWVATFLPQDALVQATRLLCLRTAAAHLLVILLGLGILVFMAYRRSEFFERRSRNLALGILSGVLLVCACLSLYSLQRMHVNALLEDADKVGLLLAQDFQRLTMSRIPSGQWSHSAVYLTRVAEQYGNAFRLSLMNGDGQEVASSAASNDAGRHCVDQLFSLTCGSGFEAPQLLLNVNLQWTSVLHNFVDAGLDMLTLSVIAGLFMLELLLLQERRAKLTNFRDIHNAQSGHCQPALLVRPFMFFCLFSYDMTLSLVPLRMGELLPVDSGCREMLMGLAVMAETVGIFLGILLTGRALKKSTHLSVALCGVTAIGVGSFLCLSAQGPMQFIVGRCLDGIGYGCVTLSTKVLTVGAGLLTDMVTGRCSGSICGVALGAMLAERLGNGAIFGFTAAASLLLALLLWRLHWRDVSSASSFSLLHSLRQAFLPNDMQPLAPPRRVCSLRHMLTALKQSMFPLQIVLSVLPVNMLIGGILFFYLPVYMHEQGFSQGDIGRMFMLNSIVIICSGVFLARLVAESQSKGAYVTLTLLLGALGVLCLTGLPPLAAAPLTVLALAMSKALNTPAQSDYALALPTANILGVSGCMTVLEITQRVGRILGPLVIGTCFVVSEPSRTLYCLGMLFFFMAGLFFLCDWRSEKHSRTQLDKVYSWKA